MALSPKKQIAKSRDRAKTGLALSAGALTRVGKSPDEAFGDLFLAVQRENILGDGKTFVDLVPRRRAHAIQREYELARQDPDFDLREFVKRHFSELTPQAEKHIHHDTHEPIMEHISHLWTQLERRNRKNRGSLVALPYTYVVPGGRFSEQFYWDTYFIMLGLAADGRWRRINGMMKNYAYMIRKFGFIPTANRTYFLSRSQPPMFALMVQLLASHYGRRRTYMEYLPYLIAEYRWWTKGRLRLKMQEHKAFARLVEMPDGSRLARYYDNKKTPRPESLREDIETAEDAEGRAADRLYLHLRAAAESGWDFSSRWFTDPHDIRTIYAADIIPVDLNSLLYTLEHTIADTYRLMKNPMLARKFDRLAEKRAAAINKYCWDETEGVYRDYNFHHFKQTDSLHLAMVFPLYARVASDEQAARVAEFLEQNFLKRGGLVTTLVDGGEQWDAPNGWAPLQWIAIQGLRNYGFEELANEIKRRWIALNQDVYEREGKLVEKYDVCNEDGLGGGGEYALQDGFGWTNGVLAALMSEDD